jgi:cardiolipin synthase
MFPVAVSLLWTAYIVALIVWVIAQKRSPSSTIGWILTLSAFPYIGFVIYYFLGPRKFERRRMRRLESARSLSWYSRGAPLRAPAPSNDVSHLIQLGEKASGLPPGTCVDIEALVDGEETYDAIAEAIREAKRHVHLEYYIFEPDRIGTMFRDLLIEKAKQGVEVKLLVDAIGSNHLTKEFLKPLRDAGAEVAFFHPVFFAAFKPRPVINLRTHRKIVVCDDWTGFTGGLNITDAENDVVNPRAYHDFHLKLTGDAVRNLQHIFWEDWFYTTGEEPPRERPLPIPPVGKHIVHILGSGPDTEWAPIKRVYLSAIETSRSRVWLTTPYFVPDDAAIATLTNAALRGVDVCILLPRRSDVLLATLAARSYFDELTRAGVTIYEYTDAMIHSKTMVVDDALCFAGTVNFDPRSFLLNFEVCAMIYGRDAAQTLARQFEDDRAIARPVLKQRNVSRIGYLSEALARILGPLL